MFCYLINAVCFMLTFISTSCMFIWLWKEVTMGICNIKNKSMDGKVVLITGGNSGLGFETAVELAKRGAKLIIGCRNIKNVEMRIRNLAPMADSIDVVKLDLSSFESIQEFSGEIRSKYNHIHILINNAGISKSWDEPLTKQGFEMTIGTNYLGHALLNNLLLDLVKKAGQNGDDYSRILLVSSITAIKKKVANDLCQKGSGNESYHIDFSGDVDYEQYSKSKLSQIMYAKHLAKILNEEDCKTLVFSLHPGIVRTNIWSTIKKPLRKRFVQMFSYLTGKTPWQGAQTTVHLSLTDFSTSSKEISGTFYSDCRPRHWINHFLPKMIHDQFACKAVWDETMKLINKHT